MNREILIWLWYLAPVTALGIWLSVLEKRIRDLADQQEEWWQRHMANHPKGDG